MAEKPARKDPYDHTTEARDKKRNQKIAEAGGAPVLVRFKSAQELSDLDLLVAAGVGKSRPDAILNLVAEKAMRLKAKESED